jgi:hypothetical protein
MGLAAINAALSGSKLVWALAALLANVGSRFVVGELTPAQQGVLRHPAFKRLVLFCMIFIPTRDVLLSACLTVAASALLESLMNEGSQYCVLPDCLRRRPWGRSLSPELQHEQHQLPIGLRVPLAGPATAVHRALLQPEQAAGGNERFVDDEIDDEFHL